MRRFDFLCQTCGHVEENVVLMGDQSPRTDGPRCHDRPMDWLPQINLSLIADSARQPVEVLQPDGSSKTVEVSSLADIRRLERESEQAYRNGEGQPLRWRAYSQNASNQDINSFGAPPDARPDPQFVKRAKPRPATDAEMASIGAYGLGVSDANTSAMAGE